MIVAIIGMLVFSGTAWYLIARLPKPPPVETEENLSLQGLTAAQAKREARAQRSEHRQHQQAIGSALRTGTSVGRFTKKIVKDLNKRL